MSSEKPKKPAPGRPPPPSDLSSSTDAATPEEEFENTYKEAYRLIDHGIVLVTQGLNTQAAAVLQKGLTVVDKALSIKVEAFNSNAEKIQQYTAMQHKMRCTRKEVLSHFTDVQTVGAPGAAMAPQVEDAPPSYDDYLRSLDEDKSGNNSAGSSGNVSYPRLNAFDPQVQEAAFAEIADTSTVTPVMSPQQGEMIFQIENGVQIFFIQPDGGVTSPSYPSFLAVFTVQEAIGSATAATAARGFIQVGEWSYPLIPAQSPVLHSFYGAYIFPDAGNSVPGSSVGVIIPDTVDKEKKEFFEQILMQMTSYQEQVVPPGVDSEEQKRIIQQSTSQRIAAGAETLSKGVVWGAEKLGELISYGSESLKGYVQPVEQKKEIDPKWHTSAKVARNVSSKAVKISGFLLSNVGKATMALGRTLAPHLQKQGTRAISHLTGQKEKEASANMDGVLEVASGALRGASTIYLSLETAAATLATNITDNTVKVVAHKYGEDAGALADNTLYAVGQTAWAGHNIASLGVKGIAKRTAKDTGKALIHQHESKKKTSTSASAEPVEKAVEAMEIGDSPGTPPVKPVREKKKPLL
ncbi:protein spartin-like isoform X2 [Homarus americanus]|uniref:protein spartin-like isoform X2 n=1 Tax=Homarus americanus TaxID=6706 RepID=UPI001C44110F|nr:protein spartin-like isoform X2 [Homarus americanus]